MTEDRNEADLICPRDGCGHSNPASAQFCERCGHALVAASPDESPGLAAGPASEQPLTVAEEAAPPVVPPPGQHPAGFEAIGDKPHKLWHVGTLVYTTGGLMLLFFWLLFGDFALSIRERSVGPMMQLMLKGFQANNLTMAVLLSMIPTAITLVLSPVISFKSDRLRSRWGRRIPFLLIPTPIAAVAMIGLAFCPQMAYALEAATGHAITHKTALLIIFGLCWTGFEIAVVVSNAVFNGLINDVVPRPVLGRFFALFRAVSLIDGIIFNTMILGHAEQHFTLICTWIAIVFGIGFTLMCLMVKEGDYPNEQNDAFGNAVAEATKSVVGSGPVMSLRRLIVAFGVAARIYVRECFSHPHYLWIFAAFTLTSLAANPINSWSIVYAKQLSMSMDGWSATGIGFGNYRLGYGGVIGLTYVFSLTLAYPIGSLVDRFHPLRVAMAAMMLYAVACLVGYALIGGVLSFGWALLAHGVLSGCYFTSSAALGQVLLPRARFSQFWSAGVVVTQLGTLIYTPLLGVLLDLTDSNYRITFLLSGIFACVSLLLLVKVYVTFMRMGGPSGYVAPLPAGVVANGFDVEPAGPRH